MRTILQDEKECYVCQTRCRLEDHHIFHGRAYRKKSEARGLKVWLCAADHRGDDGVHFNHKLDLELKKLAQEYYEEHYGNRKDFINEFGKSYCDVDLQ